MKCLLCYQDMIFVNSFTGNLQPLEYHVCFDCAITYHPNKWSYFGQKYTLSQFNRILTMKSFV